MENNKLKGNIQINIDVNAIKSAAKNAENMEKMVLEIPVIDPTKLTLRDTIFGFTVKPVNDEIRAVRPSTLRYVAIQRTNINSLDSTTAPNCITVNGTIDIPKDRTKTSGIGGIFVKDEETARVLATVLTENELERSKEILKEAKDAKEFLEEQLSEDRF